MKDRPKPLAIAILGPTACGKSAVAEELARRLRARIINADASQMYRGLDVGTGKPADHSRYELLDILDLTESFSAGRFVRLARPFCVSEAEAGRHCIVCGGTGLYVRALFEEYSDMRPPAVPDERRRLIQDLKTLGPEALAQREGVNLTGLPAQTIANPVRFIRFIERARAGPPAKHTPQPWPARKLKIGLRLPADDLRKRIRQRVEWMMQNGWTEEVRQLLKEGATPGLPGMRAIGYRQMIDCIEGSATEKETREGILSQTWKYARRQMTWLRKEPGMIWVDADVTSKRVADRIHALFEEGGIRCNG
ncbi:MAG: tRNA (adenosine(37)-N6)-dimethylallyltransferase MiaA [Armatimonadetes bacterium]|nr:tRNA (adenosine(37)-N6)-dimethylallyltransferase MiaA [Armatimonadota bacterium]